MTQSTILFEIKDSVAFLTLNRPNRQNAFNALMYEEVRAAVKQVQPEKGARVLLLTGSGSAFCAGHDLGNRSNVSRSDISNIAIAIEKGCNPLIRGLHKLELPVICAVNGAAAGAGVNLALACDIVLAARSASFTQDAANFGLVPDSGGTWFLPRIVGHARAMGLAMLGDSIDAEQAERWGMIWKCVDDDNLMHEAHALAQRVANQPTLALALTKRAINIAHTKNLDEQLDVERDCQRQAGRTEDYREGLAAFAEQRDPDFTGR
jgi:2-(1,2-epoxy-1,2-dihydrophenyl)acetyl-CoA isomerase